MRDSRCQALVLLVTIVALTAGDPAAAHTAGLASPLPQDTRPAMTVAPPGVVQRIELTDGSVIYGRIVAVADAQVTVELSVGGLLQLERSRIVEVKRVSVRPGAMASNRETASPTRLFFAPTARPLSRGETTFGVYEVLLPFVQVGITDWFSVGGGTQLFFGDNVDRIFWVTPKLTFYSRHDVNLAAGVVHLLGVDEGTGIAYGVGTFGPTTGAITVGLGYAYAGRSRATVLMLGAEKSLGRRVRFITENWIWKGGYGILSAGVRFQGEHLSADVGLGTPIDNGSAAAFAFPMVNFSYRF